MPTKWDDLPRDEMEQRYLWDGLDLEKYDVIQFLPQNAHHAVVLMRAKFDTLYPYCAEYRGGGHYFATFKELAAYCNERGWL